MKSRTYKSSDWSLWIDSPQSATDFVLDVSTLNGTDTLAASTSSIKKIDAEINQITLVDGTNPTNDVLYPIIPPQLTASLSVKNFELDYIRNFYIGKSIWLMLKNEQTYVDPIYGTNTVYFMGRITDFDVSINPGEDFSTVTLSASSIIGDYLNQLVTITQIVGQPLGAALSDKLVGTYFADADIFYGYGFGTAGVVTKTFGEWFEDLLLQGAGKIVSGVSYGNGFIPNGANYDLVWTEHLDIDKYYIAPDSSSGIRNIIGIELGWNNSNSPTIVVLTDINDPNKQVIYETSISSVDKEISFEAETDINLLSDMNLIAQNIATKSKRLLPTSVTVLNYENNQKIDYLEDSFGGWSYWLRPINDALIVGDTISFNSGLLNIPYYQPIITGRTINIDTERWTTTYDLWIG